MRVFLILTVIGGVLQFLYITAVGKSAIHEIEAAIYMLTAVVALVGDAIITRMDAAMNAMKNSNAPRESGEEKKKVAVVEDKSMYRFETAIAYKASLEEILSKMEKSQDRNQLKILYNQALAILDWMKEDFPSHYAEHGVGLGQKLVKELSK